MSCGTIILERPSYTMCGGELPALKTTKVSANRVVIVPECKSSISNERARYQPTKKKKKKRIELKNLPPNPQHGSFVRVGQCAWEFYDL